MAEALMVVRRNAMAMKITTEILESYLQCRYKSHLKLVGELGTPSDYERLLHGARARVRLMATDKLLSQYGASEVLCRLTVTPAVLKHGVPLVLDAIVEDKGLAVCFDALQRVPGSSRFGDFYYLPVLFHEAERCSQLQPSLLDLYGLILGALQGRVPGYGLLMHGLSCAVSRITLHPQDGQARRALQELRDLQTGTRPRRILNSHCPLCEFRQRCHAEAMTQDDLSLLRGLRAKEITKYHRRGIFTVTQLSCTFRPRRRWQPMPAKPPPHQAPLQALAIRDQKIYIYGTPQLPLGTTRIYVDLEGDPDRRFIYLLGMVVQAGEREERYSFWADTAAEEPKLYQQFLEVVGRYQDGWLYTYGSYEAAFLRRMLTKADGQGLGEPILSRFVNVLSIIYAHVYFPTYSNSLKDIGQYLGCRWTAAEASGLQSIVWRRQWEATGAVAFKDMLTTYNIEDCLALRKVTEFLSTICSSRSSPAEAHTARHTGHQVSRVEEIEPSLSRREWGPAVFALPDFAFINQCAYFDYQRDRVFIRASPSFKRHQTRTRSRQGKKNLRVNRCIELSSQTCPFCHGEALTRRQDGRLTRVAFDLWKSRGGLRRWVTRYTTAWHWCGGCGKRFLPREYLCLDEHGDALKSWAMYEHVVHRTSFANIAEKLKEYFGLPVFTPDVHTFKRLLSRSYEDTYRRLLAQLVGGSVLHADETEVHLQRTGKGYVWVFTNLEEVVFMYRPSREGGFLRDLLQDFHGVLVSDFYAPYDALACAQQKCLIHLMRDFNHDVKHNPSDEELKTLAVHFGRVLRGIVATIDRYGLKQWHLGKHRRDVDTLFHVVSGQMYRSEVAEGYRKRLMKYQDKLFTFLHYDGVPWNNNNAEHALKRFAYYREIVDGQFSEAGLQEYLVLLSLYVTCKYKGLSFLQFLLSKEKDVDIFRANRGQGTSQPTVDLVPEGFTFSRRKRPRDWDHIRQQPYRKKGESEPS
jgi:predicted RecB family nuclease